MSWPAAPRDDDGVEAHAFRPQPGPLREIKFGRTFDACLLPRTKGNGRRVAFLSRLDLDETDDARGRSRDEIDLAGMRADAAAEDSVEFAHQEKRGERFAAPPALLGFAPRGQTPVSLAHGVRS